MRAGDQLGQPGGAAGEQEHRDVPAVRRGGLPAGAVFDWVRILGAQPAQVHAAVAHRIPGHQHVPQPVHVADELVRELLVVEAAQLVGNGDRRRLGVLGQVGQLVPAVTR
jgi:hypothetical protein